MSDLLRRLKGVWCVNCELRGHRCQAQIFEGILPRCLRCADGEDCIFEVVHGAAIERRFACEVDPCVVPDLTAEDREYSAAMRRKDPEERNSRPGRMLRGERYLSGARANDVRRTAEKLADRAERRRAKIIAELMEERPARRLHVNSPFTAEIRAGIMRDLTVSKVPEVAMKYGFAVSVIQPIARRMGVAYFGSRKRRTPISTFCTNFAFAASSEMR